MITFEQVYRAYVADVRRFALWLSGDPLLADDITSETFIRAWTSPRRIRTATLKAYLLTIARRYYLGQRRRLKNRAELPPELPDPAPGPERLSEGKAELERIRRLLRELPEPEAAALLLRAQQGLAYEEIARLLGISLSAARVKVHRARRKIMSNP